MTQCGLGPGPKCAWKKNRLSRDPAQPQRAAQKEFYWGACVSISHIVRHSLASRERASSCPTLVIHPCTNSRHFPRLSHPSQGEPSMVPGTETCFINSHGMNK